MKKIIAQVMMSVVLITVIAGFPNMVMIEDDLIAVKPKMLIDGLRGILQGGLIEVIDFQFFLRMLKTFVILLLSVSVGLTFALIVGLFFARYRVFYYIRSFISMISVVPDFIIILFAVMLAVKFYEWTGIRLITISSNKSAIDFWFPVFILAIAPSFYFLKLIYMKYIQLSGEDYIRTALSKGLKETTIHLQHVYRNSEGFIRAELTKGLSLTIGNLFIVEFLLNIPGLTNYIFAVNNLNATLLGLTALFIDALAVYLIIKIGLSLFKRGFLYE